MVIKVSALSSAKVARTSSSITLPFKATVAIATCRKARRSSSLLNKVPRVRRPATSPWFTKLNGQKEPRISRGSFDSWALSLADANAIQMGLEPIAGEPRRIFESSFLLEEMRCPGHEHQLFVHA